METMAFLLLFFLAGWSYYKDVSAKTLQIEKLRKEKVVINDELARQKRRVNMLSFLISSLDGSSVVDEFGRGEVFRSEERLLAAIRECTNRNNRVFEDDSTTAILDCLEIDAAAKK